MMKIIVATHNQHKLHEFQEMFKGLSFELISLNELEDYDIVEEGETSFEDNAYLKAKYYYDKYHLPVISDDSGLVVEALNGAPGVKSSRYAGENATDNDNVNKLLVDMKNIIKRDAHFVCVICYIDELSKEHYFKGIVNGTIGFKKQGTNGFGYDPIFMIANNLSFSELKNEDKNKISHRAKALKAFLSYMNKNPKSL